MGYPPPDGARDLRGPRRYRRELALAAIAVLALACLASVMIRIIGSRHEGEPLPVWTLDQVAARTDNKPIYVRLAGVHPRRDLAWLHAMRTGRSRSMMFYAPLAGPSWHDGDRIALLEAVQATSSGDRSPPRPDGDPSAAVEGRLDAFALHPQDLSGLRAHGLRVDLDTAVLVRLPLHGRIPGASALAVLLPFIVLWPFVLILGLTAVRGVPAAGRIEASGGHPMSS